MAGVRLLITLARGRPRAAIEGPRPVRPPMHARGHDSKLADANLHHKLLDACHQPAEIQLSL